MKSEVTFFKIHIALQLQIKCETISENDNIKYTFPDSCKSNTLMKRTETFIQILVMDFIIEYKNILHFNYGSITLNIILCETQGNFSFFKAFLGIQIYNHAIISPCSRLSIFKSNRK